ncbi:MAG: NADP-dependent malic enzyme [Spirochaetota bacterium]
MIKNSPQDKKELFKRQALDLHESSGGKIATSIKVPVRSLEDLALAYSPGVAEPCRQIANCPADAFRYTNKSNTVAVISDGSAVLGLGNIGPLAGLPVMEGKALLFKHFAGLDAVPLCLDVGSPQELIDICCALAPNYGGMNLEDIAAPNCVIVERELQQRLSIPVFHDDQHGTAIVCAAAMLNAAKLTARKFENMRVVISGMGSAGTAIARLLKKMKVGSIFAYDAEGPLLAARNFVQEELFAEQVLDVPPVADGLTALLQGADAFIGVSASGLLRREMIAGMAADPIILAMANPDPEIMPAEALAAGAAVVGTGRMDYPNQINNVLAFPGVFRGALEAQKIRAPQGLPTRITEKMKTEAVRALADVLGEDELSTDCILPSPMDPRVVKQVSRAVYEACQESQEF